MRSRLITDPQDRFDSYLDKAWEEFHANFFPAQPRNSGGNPSTTTSEPVEILATPALTSEAVQSSGAQSGPTTVNALTTGGITINLLYDAAAMAAPASFRAGIQQAASILTSAISDKITVNIKIDYSGTGGGAAAGPDAGLYESYTSVRADLINNATPGDTTFNALPSGSSIQGQTNVAVWNAQLKLWGVLGANDTTTDDGSATFATDINSGLLVGVALHELTHAMGRVPYGSAPDIFDLFRFTSTGTRLFSGSATAPGAFFSVDGGTTKLADYGKTSDPSDFLNSGVQGSSDPFNEFYGGGTLQGLTAADKAQLDALGFHTMVAQNGFVVAATTSEAIQGGPAVTLLSGPPTITDPASATLSSATIKIANAGGSAVTGDQLYINGQQSGTVDGGLVTVSWNNSSKTLNLVGPVSIATYQTLLSQITYQDAGTDSSTGSHPLRTTTWTVNDGTTNIIATSQIAIDRPPIVTAANVALNAGYLSVAASSLFTASDPDNDTIATYGFKDTGNGYFVLNGVAQAHNQEIDVTAAQLSQLAYQNATGTDTLQVRVNNGMLWSNWANFTVTGPVVTVIESFGSTSLTQVGNTFYLYNSGGTGPELKYSGMALVANQFGGGWAPIGAEQTANGYEIAWKVTGSDTYSIWNTDSNGNYVSSTVASPGADYSVQSAEPSFHQDLNDDGHIGLTTTVIEANGSTSLTQVGNNFYLYNSGGTGPELKFGGAAVAVGQFGGGWAPIGAEQTANGYEIAWKVTGSDTYSIWNTDSNGNYVSSTVASPGADYSVQSAEPSFHQDLNDDGHIGLTTTVIEANGSTSLTQVGNNFYLYNSGGTGPELKFGGAAVAVGQFGGGWAPIGAEQTANGYEIAWKVTGSDTYSIWNADSNGNYVSSTVASPGADYSVQSAEPSFHQDLNGDGHIGLTTTVIEANGSTSLTQVGNNFYLYNSGGTGPELKFGGAAVAVGQFGGGWAPIGAEQTANGYEIAWKVTGSDTYSIWNTDSNGNYVSSTVASPGADYSVQSAEPSFHQDLNDDGHIGLTTTVIEANGSTSLTQVGNNFYLYNSGGTGPEFKFGGAAVAVGQFGGGWAPIGAEQTANGYEIAWKVTGSDTYSIWNADSNGNYVSSTVASPGADYWVQSAEPNFYQDLNGDGHIGLSTVIEATGNILLILTPFAQAAKIDVGATLELAGAASGSITFSGSTGTLILDHSSTFSGQIFDFAGNGILSGSDQIDLRDIAFASGTVASYAGNTSGGTLTIADAQNHNAHISLAGNYNGSTFSLFSDGNGGTLVIDPPVTLDTASGTLSFNDLNSTDQHIVCVSPHGGGSGYVGNFTLDALGEANGQDTVGWHFNLEPNSITQATTQSYDVTISEAHSSVTANQTVSVTVGGPGNDTFVFHPGVGTDVIVNARSADIIELDGFSSLPDLNQLTALLNVAQAGQPQSTFQSANNGHDTVMNLGNHDIIALENVHLADLHASNFIIR